MQTPDEISRRTFAKQTLGTLLTYSLLETICTSQAVAETVKPITLQWLSQVNQLGRDVRDQEVSQIVWQQQIEELFRQVELPELLRLVDFERLTKDLKFVDSGAKSLKFSFPKVEGLPSEYVFGKQIFALKKGRSVVPHGHNNMATAFLVLEGDLRGRHYDRLEDHKDSVIVKPTIDRKFGPGECSSVSDYKDNIHWFQAKTEPAYIFNLHVLNVRPGNESPTGRVYVDPAGEALAGGLIRAPRISYKVAHEKYG